MVGAGDNVQQDAHDVFLLDVPQTLDGSDIIITAVVFKQTQDPNDLYAVTAALTQNGEPVESAVPGEPGGVLTVTGRLDKTIAIALQYKIQTGRQL